MRLNKLYIALIFGTLFSFSISTSIGAVISSDTSIELEQRPGYCHSPVITIGSDQNKLPCSGSGADHGGAGSTHLSASDAVPHVSVTSISSLTFAFVIALVNNDEHDGPTHVPDAPRLTVLHKVLFRSIISPNAP
ncbi:MAG TPA: hypothetical protein VFE50_13830 [Cyclobacteriaceae bacterium]|nr:hypothetical protein [Cyclobacteriaceae bacterium]